VNIFHFFFNSESFRAERDTAGVGTGMEKVEEANTDHQPGLSLGDGPQVPRKLPSELVETKGLFVQLLRMHPSHLHIVADIYISQKIDLKFQKSWKLQVCRQILQIQIYK